MGHHQDAAHRSVPVDSGTEHDRLRESEERFRVLVEAIAQATWETDAAGIVVADSPSWRAYTGQTLAQWLGYGWLEVIHPQDRAHAERQWREAVAACRYLDGEYRLRSPDGGWRWTNVRAAPIRSAEGEVIKWVGMNIDITDRKEMERSLIASEQHLRIALDMGYTVAFEWDIQRNEVRRQHSRLGALPETPEERPSSLEEVAAAVHPDDRERFLANVHAALAHPEQGYRGEHRLCEPDGRIIWLAEYGYLQCDGQGQPQRLIGLSQDITERKRSEEALRKSEERQAFLLKLSDALRAEPDAGAAANRAVMLLADALQTDRCYITAFRPGADFWDVVVETHSPHLPPLPAQIRAEDHPESVLRLPADQTLVYDNIAEHAGLTDRDRASLAAMDFGALVAAFVRRGAGNAVWGMVAVAERPRRWTPTEVALVEQAAERTWAAMERARAEEVLRASEEKYRALFESIDEGFCTFDMIFDDAGVPIDYRFVEYNPAFERHTGLTGVVGRTIREIVPDQDREWLEIYGGVAMTGEPVRVIRYGQALKRWFAIYAFRVGEPEQRRVAALFSDITARKEVELSLQASQERLTLATDATELAVFEWDLVSDRVTANDRLRQWYGVGSAETMTGAHLLRGCVHPSDLVSVEERVRQAMDPTSSGRCSFECRLVQPDTGREKESDRRKDAFLATWPTNCATRSRRSEPASS
jgi:PAS domain S-box-containing protein